MARLLGPHLRARFNIHMNTNTESEDLFELFCDYHKILWEKIPPNKTKTPDYLIKLNDQILYFEIKQLEKDDDVSKRVVGKHIRNRIRKSQKQIQANAGKGFPSILLIYNDLDPVFQDFGTGQLDFITAMYGEPTVELKNGRIEKSYYGLNAKFDPDCNTSFSALGHLHLRGFATVPIIQLYENHYAKNPLKFEMLPSCFEIVYQYNIEQ